MLKIILSDARTEADMDAIASAFAISLGDLEQGLSVGTISRWFELGEENSDNKPHLILYSGELGCRVTVDQDGNVISSTFESAGEPPLGQPLAVVDAGAARRARLEALLDEALAESFPASDPIAVCFDDPRQTTSSKRH